MTNAVAWALIHSLWQAALLGLLLLSLRLATRSAQVRYVAGVSALAFVSFGFAITLLLYLPDQRTLAEKPAATAQFSAFVDAATSETVNIAPDRFSGFTPYVTSFWLAGVCLAHLWRIAGVVSVWRLRRRGVFAAPDVWVRRLARLSECLGVLRPVALLESAMINTPILIGHLRPVILVPLGLLAKLPVDQMEAVLLHELAHVRRWDYLVNSVLRFVEALFFYHPAVWWISHQVRVERENCCDDIAVAVSGNGYRYAQALAALELSRFGRSHPALAASAGSLAPRVRRILQPSSATGVRGAISSLALVVATGILAVAGWPQTQVPLLPPPQTIPRLSPQVDSTIRPGATKATPLSGAWRKWLDEDVVYIISDAEATAYRRLENDDDRVAFIQRFWERRGSTPAGESVKEEHYFRIAYANGRFLEGVSGWRTDRGRIYITLGPPDEIESHPSAAPEGPPYEIWRYSVVGADGGQRSFTFVDKGGNGKYLLQKPGAPNLQAVFNRLLRWTVTDPLNRFVTGLEQEHFDIRENGFSKSLVYFEGPDSQTAIAVCSDAELTFSNLANFTVQTRNLQDAIRHVSSQPTVRKAIVNAGCLAPPEGTVIPGGILAVNSEPAMVNKWIVELTNQYVGGYVSESPGTPAEVNIRKQPPGLPTLEIRGLTQ